jgi:citrate lyase subunit beta / citryl-CoA lyase
MHGAPIITMLFTPGTAEDKLAKIPRTAADAFILDLEDSVATARKQEARRSVARTIGAIGDKECLYVRINALDTPYFADDLEGLIGPGLTGIDIPKVSTADDVRVVDRLISHYERRSALPPGTIELMATIETAAGLGNIEEIARSTPRLRCLCFGATDFALDLGLRQSGSWAGETLAYARVKLVVTSRACGLDAPHDSVYPNYQDIEGLRAAATRGRELGFGGMHAIHPAQLPVIAAAYAVSDEEVTRARKVVSEFSAAVSQGTAAIGLDGQLVDYPVLYHAQRLLAAAERQSHG